jgi:hypothetical protein
MYLIFSIFTLDILHFYRMLIANINSISNVFKLKCHHKRCVLISDVNMENFDYKYSMCLPYIC